MLLSSCVLEQPYAAPCKSTSENAQNANFAVKEFPEVRRHRVLRSSLPASNPKATRKIPLKSKKSAWFWSSTYERLSLSSGPLLARNKVAHKRRIPPQNSSGIHRLLVEKGPARASACALAKRANPS